MATSNATCDYCSELFTDPRMLPCLHSFCLQCLNKISEIKGAKEALQCPTCNEKAPLQEDGVDAFPKDQRKAHEAEVAQCILKAKGGEGKCEDCVGDSVAVAFCVVCHEFLCKSCEEHHRLSRKTMKHEILITGERMGKENEESILSNYPEQPIPCPLHKDEVLKFYCEKCEKLICRDCKECEHDDHRNKCNRVEKMAAKAMESLMTSLESGGDAIAALDNTVALCKKVSRQVESRKKEVDNMITQSLNQVRVALLAKNEEIRLRKVTALQMQVSELERVRDGLSFASSMATAAQSYTPAQQLSTKKVIAERAALLLQQFRDSDLTPLENDMFLTKIAEPAIISQMISLGQIVGGSHAASSTCDVGYVPRAVVGKERTIKVTTRDEEGEPFPHGGEVVEAKLNLMGSQKPPIRGKTSDDGDGTYSISFSAQSAGEHELQVTIANRHIKGSPFTLTARQSHAASSTCDAGSIPQAVVGKECTIKVTVRDQVGDIFPHGGDVVEAKLSLVGSPEPPIRGKTLDHGDGTYSISFTAQSAGEHELQVTIANRHIRGSPFIYLASHSYAASSTCDVGYIPRAVVGKERTIKVTARDEEGKPLPHGGDTIEAKLNLMGSQKPPIRGKTSDRGDGTYSISFTAQSAGEHKLQVTIANHHIKGSPFTLTARQPRTTPYTSLACQKNISTNANPWDVAVTEDGSLAVAEYGYNTVSLYSVNGQRQFTFGSYGSGDGQFSNPADVAIKGDVMYVSDQGNCRVQKFSISRRSFISKFGSSGSGNGQFSSPHGICIDPEGKVYVVDQGNNRIQVFQADGTFAYSITADPNNPDSKFQSPWGLAFDPQGHLHIAAYGSHCIKVFTTEGTHIESYGSGTIQYPAGIAIDEVGYIAITGYGSNHLWIYNPGHTQLIKTIQDSSYPAGVSCDAEGTFWVAAYGNNCVKRY